MAEIWGAAIAVGGSVISGYAKGKSDKKAADRARSDAKAATRDEAMYSGLLSQFENDNEYYMQQVNRQNKQRGLAEFRKFNTVSNYAPTYQQDTSGIVVPNRPDISTVLAAVPTEQQQTAKKSGGLLGKIGGLF